jgi:phosphatidylglycerophosphatase A
MPRSFDAPPSIQDVQPKRFIPYPEDAGAAPDAATRSAPAAAAAPTRPTLAFMLRHPAHWLGLGFGSGLSPIAPGTAGTLWAWAVFVLLQQVFSPAQLGGLIALSLPIGWWACTITARNLGRDDPGCIVWDEVVAMWLILWLLAPASWHGQLLAFALFRLFDAAKPHPVRWADQCFKGSGWRGGWGILFDDLVAAFCTLLVLAAGRHFGLW